jgi:mannose-1-phosphate guanylyltransferase
MVFKTAFILAGGYGKRLRPLTEETPKPLLEVGGKPIIVWQINWLKNHGIDNIVVLAGYKGELVKERLGNGKEYGVELDYVFEKEPLGTGGALYNAREKIIGKKEFFVINGDVITNLNPNQLAGELDENSVGVLAAVPLPSPYGILDIDENSKIRRFVEKPLIENVWISAGVYLLKESILNYLPQKGDIEKTAFPELGKEGKLKAYKYKGVFWKSIDSHKDLEEMDKILRTNKIF